MDFDIIKNVTIWIFRNRSFDILSLSFSREYDILLKKGHN